MEFKDKLERALKLGAFAGAEVSLEVSPTGRVGGILVSPSFQGFAHVDRQERLWKFLESEFNAGELVQIVSILTLTPSEVSEAN